MRLNVGAGALRLPGFVNVDVRDVGSDSVRGHAGDLSFADDRSVDIVFSHAVFEHVYPAHRPAVLREWKRVLSSSGAAVCLGLPNFREVARLYIECAAGISGPTFDLFEVYRYSHGHPEMMTEPGWSDWDPLRNENQGPRGYVPQLHKGLFDVEHLSALLAHVPLPAMLLTYAYPGEEHALNIGFVAGPDCDDPNVASARLEQVPELDRWIDPSSLSWQPLARPQRDRLLEEILRLERTIAPSKVKRVARRLRRLLPAR